MVRGGDVCVNQLDIYTFVLGLCGLGSGEAKYSLSSLGVCVVVRRVVLLCACVCVR